MPHTLLAMQVDVASLMTQDDETGPSVDSALPLHTESISLEVTPNDDEDSSLRDCQCLPGLPVTSRSPASRQTAHDRVAGVRAEHTSGNGEAGTAAGSEAAHGEANAALQHWSDLLLG